VYAAASLQSAGVVKSVQMHAGLNLPFRSYRAAPFHSLLGGLVRT